MSRALQRKQIWVVAAIAALAVGLGCSTKSPTAPVQVPAQPPGTQVSATWRISVSITPRELTVGTDESATVSITVRRLDDDAPPINGSTIVVSTTLGDFDAPGSGLQSVVLGTVNGRTEIQLYPGDVVGSALVTAQLEASAGQAAMEIVRAIEPVVAAFAFANSNDNLSVQFQNLSTGSPDKFRWDFGDGASSREENPSHLYDAEGDYVVTLTASKKGSEDTASQIVSVTEDPDDVIEASFEFTVDDRTVVFQDTSTGNPTSWSWDFGDGTRSSLQNPTHTYAREGAYVVVLTARNRRTEGKASQTVIVSEDVFITDISPNSGSAAGGTPVTISGKGFITPLRVFFGDVLATVTSSTSTRISVITPPGTLVSEACEIAPMTPGTRFFDTAVDVRVELDSGTSDVVSGGFVYLSPTGSACVP